MTPESDAEHPTTAPALAGAVDIGTTLGRPVADVWQALVSAPGSAVWLGEGAVLGGKGQSYRCADGARGVVRSVHPLEQLRVSWHRDGDAPATLVEIDLEPQGERTAVRLRHEGIDTAAHSGLEQHWRQRLTDLDAHLAGRA